MRHTAFDPENLQAVLGKGERVMSKLIKVCQMIEKMGTEELNAGFVIYNLQEGVI